GWTPPVTTTLSVAPDSPRVAYPHAGGPGQLPPDGIFDLIPAQEQSPIDGHTANFTYRGLGNYNDNFGNPNSWRASASYATGAHNLKIGYQGSYLIANTENIANNSQLSYRFNNRVPNAFSYRLQDFQQADRTKVLAL